MLMKNKVHFCYLLFFSFMSVYCNPTNADGSANGTCSTTANNSNSVAYPDMPTCQAACPCDTYLNGIKRACIDDDDCMDRVSDNAVCGRVSDNYMNTTCMGNGKCQYTRSFS